ncbi:head maturation protease, ClpP-related [uncultured Microbacterium sp.]|uniref:head maturation protease, ClpP-related n=1 Tax=uncultured Microbacterium sp. TaxID=191216 RepID=UPI0026009452|nr:head maturation protease, ClpP-related [uncultured Microbacterium sp.]
MKPTNRRAAGRSWYRIHNETEEPDTAEVLIYEQIGESFWGGGVSAKQFAEDFAAITAPNINVRINSPGGSVFDGQAIFNAIDRHPSKVTTHIDGLAASIASVIALAGDEVVMASNALYMIHDPWAAAVGDASEMRKTADLLDKIAGQLVDTYAAKSGQDPADIAEAMHAETWYTAAEALDLGLIDRIAGETSEEPGASFDMTPFNYRNYPGRARALAPVAAATIPAAARRAVIPNEQENPVDQSTTAVAEPPVAHVPTARVQDAFPYRPGVRDERGEQASMFRDGFRAWAHRDAAAQERFDKATLILADAGTQSDVSEIIPTQYRPDLYVGQIAPRRPVIEAFSQGTLTSIAPQRIPKFSTASGLMADHVENTNPASGTFETTEQVVSPKAVSGLYDGSREMFEAATPELDALIMTAIRNEYASDSEAYAATTYLAGATAGTVVDISDGVTMQVLARMITFAQNRSEAADAFLAGTSLFPELVKQVDSTGRPLNPFIGATNAPGQVSSKLLSINVGGYETPYVPSLSGGLLGKREDAFTWESGIRTWKWEEVGGPGTIRIAAFGYILSAVTRALGLLKFATQA